MEKQGKNPRIGQVRLSVSALLFLSLVSPLLAQDIFPEVRAAADAGDAKAQFALGDYYFRVRFQTLDYADVLIWYRKAAAQGYAPAQNQLGSMYENNTGLPPSDKSAVNEYRLAANQGYAPAQYNLAVMYEDGRGVKRDYKQALAWYRKAADQNLSIAEKQIGYFYQCGFGVKRDFAQAMSWYRRAADHGNADAENQLGYMAEEGWGEPQDYKVALSWFYKAAQHGSNQAEENIGYIFQHGTGVQTDYARAMSWFIRAAAQGNSDAENQLGWMYQFGQGVRVDNARALTWYGLAGDLGNTKGKNNFQSLTDDLEDDGGELQNASRAVSDAAIAQAQRWANIRDLQRRIDAAEAHALYQDDYAGQLQHIGHGKSAAMAKVFNAMGSVGAVQHQVEAESSASKQCVYAISWLKSKAKTNPPPALPLPDSTLPVSSERRFRIRNELMPWNGLATVTGVVFTGERSSRADQLALLLRSTPISSRTFAAQTLQARSSLRRMEQSSSRRHMASPTGNTMSQTPMQLSSTSLQCPCSSRPQPSCASWIQVRSA